MSTDNKTESVIVSDKHEVSIAESLEGFTEAQVSIVKKNVAKGTNNSELAYFLHVCQSLDLNPLNKEIWCYKDNRQNLLIFSGRDGFLAKAQKNPIYNGIRSGAIYSEDEFSIDIPSGVINHQITKKKKDRGEILYGYCFVFRKDGEPTLEIADFDTYNKTYNAWKTHPEEMIKKVAESHALKKAFGISGLQIEYDYDIKGGVAVPVNSDRVTLEKVKEMYEHKKDSLNGDDQMRVEHIIQMQEKASYKKVYTKMQAL